MQEMKKKKKSRMCLEKGKNNKVITEASRKGKKEGRKEGWKE